MAATTVVVACPPLDADHRDRLAHASAAVDAGLERFRCRDGEISLSPVTLVSEVERFQWAAAGLPQPDRRILGGHRHETLPELELADTTPPPRLVHPGSGSGMSRVEADGCGAEAAGSAAAGGKLDELVAAERGHLDHPPVDDDAAGIAAD